MKEVTKMKMVVLLGKVALVHAGEEGIDLRLVNLDENTVDHIYLTFQSWLELCRAITEEITDREV